MAPTPLGRKAIRLGAAMLTLGAIAAPGFATSAWAKGSSPAKLDQCADGPRSAPVLCVTAKSWVNGNLGPSKSHYFEGDSIPYRLELGGLNPGADVHTAVIQWDNTQKGKHAIDYITTYDRTVTADPCAGVATCGSPTMEPIPADPEAINQVAGAFTIFGGSITGVSAYTESGSSTNGSSSITISFTASVDDPVLAWGGHIASQADWGKGNSAISISGSPYHMRLLSFDGTGGNQDRSLGNAAVAPVVTPPTPTPTPDPVVTPTPTVTPTPGSTPTPQATQTPAPGSPSGPSSNGIVSVLGEQVTRPAPASVSSDQAPAQAAAQGATSQAAPGSATELPMTGSNSGPLAVAAIAFMMLGGTLCLLGRLTAAE